MTREEKIALLKQSDSTKPISREEKIRMLQDADAKNTAPNVPMPGEEQGLLSRAWDKTKSGIVATGEAIDRYSGAPSRAAFNAALSMENPFSAFSSQFGKDPKLAPTGQEIAENKLGFEDKARFKTEDELNLEADMMGRPFSPVTMPSSQAGLVVDTGADVTNVLPFGAAAKGTGMAAGIAAKGAGKAVKGAAKAVDAITGTELLTKSLGTIGEGVEKTVGLLNKVVSPKQAADFTKKVDIAKKNGIDPSLLSEAIEFGPSSFISRGARSIREGASGEAELLKHAEGANQISQATEKKIANLGGGEVLDIESAGKAVRDSYNSKVDDLFNSVDQTYKNIRSQAGGVSLSPESYSELNKKISGVRELANDLTKNAITKTDRAQGVQLLNAINQIEKSSTSLGETISTLQRIGRSAFKKIPPGADVPVDQKQMQKLYYSLRDAVYGTVNKIDPKAGGALGEANKSISKFLDDSSFIIRELDNVTISDDRVFKRIFSDPKKIEKLKEIMPEKFQQLRSTYLDELMPRNPEGSVNYGTALKKLDHDSVKLKKLFSESELSEIKELLELGRDHGPAVLSYSGTGASQGFKEMGSSIYHGLINKNAVEAMKARARKVPRGTPPKGSVPEGAMGFAPGDMIPARSALERRAKGVQSLSPSLQEDSERTKSRERKK